MTAVPDPTEVKVLLVDDIIANLDLLRDMLSPLGYQIYFATSGEKALGVAASSIPDVVLMDVMMPQMDGFEACRQMKAREELRDIPVIFVTARTEVEDLARGFEAGGVDYITKPVKQPEVLARVRTHVRIRWLIRQQQAHLAALEQARRELQELNATKDKFLSNLGREVSAALARISGAPAGPQHPHDAPGPRENGQGPAEVKASAQEVLRLLGTILEWPRLQSGQKLDLLATPITDRGLRSLLENLHDLRFLSLAETHVGDEGLAHLGALHRLQELHLDYTDITDAGLHRLTALPDLRILDLKGTRVTDRGLAVLGSLHTLRGLYLTRTRVTDAGLAHLSGLHALDTLILWDTAVTDAGLEHLQALRGLRELILWNTRVTPQGVARLQAALPDCEISTSAL